MGERFVYFSDLNTLLFSKINNQTSELQKGTDGTGRKMEWDCQPAHDTQFLPGTSTEPIKTHLGFCLLFLVMWYPLPSLHCKIVGQRQQSKPFSSVLVADHAEDGNYTVCWHHSSSDPCTLAEELFITYSVQINAKFKLDLQSPSQKSQGDGLAFAFMTALQQARLAFGTACKIGKHNVFRTDHPCVNSKQWSYG